MFSFFTRHWTAYQTQAITRVDNTARDSRRRTLEIRNEKRLAGISGLISYLTCLILFPSAISYCYLVEQSVSLSSSFLLPCFLGAQLDHSLLLISEGGTIFLEPIASTTGATNQPTSAINTRRLIVLDHETPKKRINPLSFHFIFGEVKLECCN